MSDIRFSDSDIEINVADNSSINEVEDGIRTHGRGVAYSEQGYGTGMEGNAASVSGWAEINEYSPPSYGNLHDIYDYSNAGNESSTYDGFGSYNNYGAYNGYGSYDDMDIQNKNNGNNVPYMGGSSKTVSYENSINGSNVRTYNSSEIRYASDDTRHSEGYIKHTNGEASDNNDISDIRFGMSAGGDEYSVDENITYSDPDRNIRHTSDILKSEAGEESGSPIGYTDILRMSTPEGFKRDAAFLISDRTSPPPIIRTDKQDLKNTENGFKKPGYDGLDSAESSINSIMGNGINISSNGVSKPSEGIKIGNADKEPEISDIKTVGVGNKTTNIKHAQAGKVKGKDSDIKFDVSSAVKKSKDSLDGLSGLSDKMHDEKGTTQNRNRFYFRQIAQNLLIRDDGDGNMSVFQRAEKNISKVVKIVTGTITLVLKPLLPAIIIAGVLIAILITYYSEVSYQETRVPEIDEVGSFPEEIELWRAAVNIRLRYYNDRNQYDGVNLMQFTNAILATIWQESSGNPNGPGVNGDIMQCRESGYWNVYLPPDWNRLSTTERSLDAGIRYFILGLKSWGVTDASDNKGLQMVMQGYNYGYGFLNWARRRGIREWSLDSSRRFASSMGGRYGHPAYGSEWLNKYLQGSAGGGAWLWPMPTGHYISSGFGARWGTTHRGIDIPCPIGSEVVASNSGTVIHVGSYGTGGIAVIVDCGDGVTNYYYHLTSYKVHVGEQVVGGQVIALSGNTGRSTGPHLHFGVSINGTYVDPQNYVNP